MSAVTDQGHGHHLDLLDGAGVGGPRDSHQRGRARPGVAPLIQATMDAETVSDFGGQVPMGRAAHPDEIAPSYVFFASERLSSYYTGGALAPIGGETMPG